LEKDVQENSFDIDESAMTFQDEKGNPFIVDGKKIINCESGCTVTAYNS
jgi:hypothetical protein